MTPTADHFGATAITVGSTSSSIDISTVTDNAWVYCWVALAGAVTGFSLTGFSDVPTQAVDGSTMFYALQRRKKVSGDGTISTSWTGSAKGVLSWISINGADGTAPDESALIAVNGATSRTVVPTPSRTPTAADRIPLAFYAVRTSSSSNKPISWVADAALSEIFDGDNSAAASSPWVGAQIAIGLSAVTNAAHSYSATHSPAAESHDGSALLYLIPGAGTPRASFGAGFFDGV